MDQGVEVSISPHSGSHPDDRLSQLGSRIAGMLKQGGPLSEILDEVNRIIEKEEDTSGVDITLRLDGTSFQQGQATKGAVITLERSRKSRLSHMERDSVGTEDAASTTHLKRRIEFKVERDNEGLRPRTDSLMNGSMTLDVLTHAQQIAEDDWEDFMKEHRRIMDEMYRLRQANLCLIDEYNARKIAREQNQRASEQH